jgi:hypothetical protein
MAFAKFLPPFHKSTRDDQVSDSVTGHFISEGEFKYIVEQAGNGAGPSYQEVSGAPVEVNSPLGYSVGPITLLFLNISMIIGTGIYSTRKCCRSEFLDCF